MKYYVIAGEASGDLHGSNLIKAIKTKDSSAEFRVWGGDKMAATGASMASHYKEMSFMGFVGLISNIFKVFQKISFCKKDIQAYQPDAIIFIDFSGFNLRIAEWANHLSTKRFYYISPQVWASRSGRIEKIKTHIDKMFCILPFEKELYKKHGLDVEYVGHPLMDEINKFKANPDFTLNNKLDNRPIIALLPGSRKQEIKSVLSTMLGVIQSYTDYQFVIAGAPSIDHSIYNSILSDLNIDNEITIVKEATYDLLSNAHAAIVTSGTATLETAIFNVPQVVVYKGSAINYWIARQIINVDYISLVNLISDKEIVKELIQGDMNARNIKIELDYILSGANREKQLKEYKKLQAQLGGEGAAEKVAEGIVASTTLSHQ